jgi:outer membrane protein assembly factor BamB
VTLEQHALEELVTCYEISTGKRIWSYSVPARYENPKWREAGVGPRSTPTIHEGLVYSLGASGRLLCLDGGTGKLVWQKDLLQEYNITAEQEQATVPFGRSTSPLVVDDLVVIPAGGMADHRFSLAAFDRKTGNKKWEAGNRQISQSSPSIGILAGRKQIISVNEDTLSGHDIDTGAVLWEQNWPGATTGAVNVSLPVIVSPNRFFISKGYGVGAALYEIAPRSDGLFGSKEIWKSNRVMRTQFTNVSAKDGFAYGLSDGILECIQIETGERCWKSGRFGHGQLLRVGDLLLVSTESGEVVLIEASPKTDGNVLARFQAIQGTTWNPPALCGQLLLIRNSQEAACYRLPITAE